MLGFLRIQVWPFVGRWVERFFGESVLINILCILRSDVARVIWLERGVNVDKIRSLLVCFKCFLGNLIQEIVCILVMFRLFRGIASLEVWISVRMQWKHDFITVLRSEKRTLTYSVFKVTLGCWLSSSHTQAFADLSFIIPSLVRE